MSMDDKELFDVANDVMQMLDSAGLHLDDAIEDLRDYGVWLNDYENNVFPNATDEQLMDFADDLNNMSSVYLSAPASSIEKSSDALSDAIGNATGRMPGLLDVLLDERRHARKAGRRHMAAREDLADYTYRYLTMLDETYDNVMNLVERVQERSFQLVVDIDRVATANDVEGLLDLMTSPNWNWLTNGGADRDRQEMVFQFEDLYFKAPETILSTWRNII